MKDQLIPNGDTEKQNQLMKDVDADDADASDLLDAIGRDSAELHHNSLTAAPPKTSATRARVARVASSGSASCGKNPCSMIS